MTKFETAKVEEVLGDLTREGGFNRELPHEVQTDKPIAKLVPCTGCQRPLVVNQFYAPAQAKCSTCRPDQSSSSVGSVAVPQPGRTDPAKAKRLADALVNPQFAKALCPLHPDDDEHEMEIKSITHSDHYGPRTLVGYDGAGRPQYRQDAVGESVRLQCRKCNTTVDYSTQHQVQYRAQNEPRETTSDPTATMRILAGVREEALNCEVALDLDTEAKM